MEYRCWKQKNKRSNWQSGQTYLSNWFDWNYNTKSRWECRKPLWRHYKHQVALEFYLLDRRTFSEFQLISAHWLQPWTSTHTHTHTHPEYPHNHPDSNVRLPIENRLIFNFNQTNRFPISIRKKLAVWLQFITLGDAILLTLSAFIYSIWKNANTSQIANASQLTIIKFICELLAMTIKLIWKVISGIWMLLGIRQRWKSAIIKDKFIIVVIVVKYTLDQIQIPAPLNTMATMASWKWWTQTIYGRVARAAVQRIPIRNGSNWNFVALVHRSPLNQQWTNNNNKNTHKSYSSSRDHFTLLEREKNKRKNPVVKAVLCAIMWNHPI